MIGMTRGIGHRHHAAEGVAIDNRLDDPKHIAERFYVIAPLRERERGLLAGGTSVGAVIDIDDLMGVGETVEIGPHGRMIEARPAMHDDQRRAFHHALAIGGKRGAHGVEEDARRADIGKHEEVPARLSRDDNGSA